MEKNCDRVGKNSQQKTVKKNIQNIVKEFDELELVDIKKQK